MVAVQAAQASPLRPQRVPEVVIEAHAWRMPTLIHGHSQSLPVLPTKQPPVTTSLVPKRARSRPRGLGSACAAASASGAGSGGQLLPLGPREPFQSAVLRCELKLREAMQLTSGASPSRLRADACLNTLKAMSRAASCFSDVLPTLTREISQLLLEHGGAGRSADADARALRGPARGVAVGEGSRAEGSEPGVRAELVAAQTEHSAARRFRARVR